MPLIQPYDKLLDGFGTAPENDPNFSNVVLLVDFDGSGGATSATDDSNSEHTLNFNATAQLDTAQKKFGTASLLLDGNSDYIDIADSNDWFLATGKFTIECHIRFASLASGVQRFLSQYNNSGNQRAWFFSFRNDGTQDGLGFHSYSNGSTENIRILGAWSPSVDTWYHVAVDRDASGDVRCYVDGSVQVGPTKMTSNIFDSNEPLGIGCLRPSNPVNFFNGHIDNVRVTKGVARYGGAFTPPSGPYPTS